MQFKTLFSAVVVGLALTAEVVAQDDKHRGFGGFGGFGQGGQGQRGGKGGSSTAVAATQVVSSTAVAVSATATAAAAKSGASGNKGSAGSGSNGSSGTGSNGSSGGSGNGGNNLELNPAAVQTGSFQDGLEASGAKAGEAASPTDPANFINFCVGKTLTNGLQQKGGSCNGIVMGDIPASTSMISTIITFPESMQDLTPNQTFNLSANIQNIVAGSFTNADATYYAGPQELQGGKVVGHMHFTVQDMNNNANPKTAMDASVFSFFKGVDDAGDGKGNLQATVTGGLPAGTYRVCTMSSSSNHQPVLMPVAQRGAQDDCTKFTVGKNSGGAGGSTASTGSTSTGTSSGQSTSSSAASTNTNKGANGGNGATGGKGQKGSQGKGGKRRGTGWRNQNW